jgi:hypothetical protein
MVFSILELVQLSLERETIQGIESSTLGKEQIVENPTFSAGDKVCMFLLIVPRVFCM